MGIDWRLDTANVIQIRKELRKIRVGYILLHKDFLRTQTGPGLEPRLQFVEQYLNERFERVESDIGDVEIFRTAFKKR